MKNIVLTGFMGTGKTTVGQLLAEKLGFTFIDTDALIEARDGRPITDIFAQSGVAAFRQMETAVALELAGRTNLVISTGGRLMLDPVNAAALTKNGRVFCLTAAPKEILRRVEETSKRPLLNVPNPATRIQSLLAQREAAYGRFTQIQTDGKTAVQVAEEIISWVSTK
ncbi:MAG: shikimate kinase [Chloroflexi bacterium]|nr:shikimate kinase [Chloroflexota bacterium]